jgi:hypothetical protein
MPRPSAKCEHEAAETEAHAKLTAYDPGCCCWQSARRCGSKANPLLLAEGARATPGRSEPAAEIHPAAATIVLWPSDGGPFPSYTLVAASVAFQSAPTQISVSFLRTWKITCQL